MKTADAIVLLIPDKRWRLSSALSITGPTVGQLTLPDITTQSSLTMVNISQVGFT